MRCLLDEDTAPDLAGILTLLGHPSQHVGDLGLSVSSDQVILEAAKEFDLFITIDLHRQFTEWWASQQAMLDTVRVIRLRFSSSQPDDGLEQARALLWRWREIVSRLEEDPEIRLTTLSGQGYRARFNSVEDIRLMPGPSQPS